MKQRVRFWKNHKKQLRTNCFCLEFQRVSCVMALEGIRWEKILNLDASGQNCSIGLQFKTTEPKSVEKGQNSCKSSLFRGPCPSLKGKCKTCLNWCPKSQHASPHDLKHRHYPTFFNDSKKENVRHNNYFYLFYSHTCVVSRLLLMFYCVHDCGSMKHCCSTLARIVWMILFFLLEQDFSSAEHLNSHKLKICLYFNKKH